MDAPRTCPLCSRRHQGDRDVLECRVNHRARQLRSIEYVPLSLRQLRVVRVILPIVDAADFFPEPLAVDDPQLARGDVALLDVRRVHRAEGFVERALWVPDWFADLREVAIGCLSGAEVVALLSLTARDRAARAQATVISTLLDNKPSPSKGGNLRGWRSPVGEGLLDLLRMHRAMG